jgi:hypothetical protein
MVHRSRSGARGAQPGGLAIAGRKGKRRERPPVETADYEGPGGSVLTLRKSLSGGTIRKIAKVGPGSGASVDDAWRRRSEMLFERLAVRWEIEGLPLDDQKMLLGRYRMAEPDTQEWVRRTIAAHVERFIPELA